MSEIYELEEMLEDLETQEEPEKVGFEINDDNIADWALRKIAEEQKEYERLASIAMMQIEEINAKLKHMEEMAERITSFLKRCLYRYFQMVPHKATKTQESYKLFSGSLVFKLPTVKMVKDDEELLKYLRSNNLNQYIKVKEEPAWGEFKKTLTVMDGEVIDTISGEVVEAVKAEQVPGTFDIKRS